jgi:hypothetical protein
VNYIPNDIDAGTLFIETWGGTRSGSWIDGGSAFISTEGWNGGREGIRD